MGWFKNIIKETGRLFSQAAESTKRVNKKYLEPGIKFGAQFDPLSRGLMQTGWFKEKGENIAPSLWAWKASTQRGPESKFGRAVLPVVGGLAGGIAGSAVGGPWGGAAGGAGGAAFGQALSYEGLPGDKGERYSSVGKTFYSTAAGGAAGAYAQTANLGLMSRAGLQAGTAAATAKLQGGSTEDAAKAAMLSGAASAGGIMGGQIAGGAGANIGAQLVGTAARGAIASARGRVEPPPTDLSATGQASSPLTPGRFYGNVNEDLLERYQWQMSPTNYRQMYAHLARR